MKFLILSLKKRIDLLLQGIDFFGELFLRLLPVTGKLFPNPYIRGFHPYLDDKENCNNGLEIIERSETDLKFMD